MIEPATISVSQGLLDTISAVYYACKGCGTYCLPGEMVEGDEGDVEAGDYLCLDCKTAEQVEYKVYQTPALPYCWIIEVSQDRRRYLVATIPNGWAQREPYRGHYDLTRVWGALALNALSSLGLSTAVEAETPQPKHDSLLDVLRLRNRRNQ